ncbi:MAG: PadR family transcriptional regulator [Coriobacteriia bacterium]|nr:PadR family transcriptional regulator [Coriobacteriia bacterium]
MSLEHAILGLLNEHPRSGYDLKTRCFDGPLYPLWAADQAQVYRTLERLKTVGLVTATRRRRAGKPDRRLYELTPAGQVSLQAWLASPADTPVVRDPLLIRLYFGEATADEDLIAVLVASRDQHQSRLLGLRTAKADLASERSIDDRTSTLRQTAFDGALARERAAIDWLDDCIDAIRDGALPGSTAAGTGQRHLFGT